MYCSCKEKVRRVTENYVIQQITCAKCGREISDTKSINVSTPRKSKWLIKQMDGSYWPTIGEYTEEELLAKMVRRF